MGVIEGVIRGKTDKEGQISREAETDPTTMTNLNMTTLIIHLPTEEPPTEKEATALTKIGFLKRHLSSNTTIKEVKSMKLKIRLKDNQDSLAFVNYCFILYYLF